MSVSLSFRPLQTGRLLSVLHSKIGSVGSPATCQRPGQWPNSSGGNSTWLSLRAASRSVTDHRGHAAFARSTTCAGANTATLTSSPVVPQDCLCHARWLGATKWRRRVASANTTTGAGGHTKTLRVFPGVRNSLTPRLPSDRCAPSSHAIGLPGLKGYATPITNACALQEPLTLTGLSRVAKTADLLSALSPSAGVWRSGKVSAPSTTTGYAVTVILWGEAKLGAETDSAKCRRAPTPIWRWDSASCTTTGLLPREASRVVGAVFTSAQGTMFLGTKANRPSTPVRCAMSRSLVVPAGYVGFALGAAWQSDSRDRGGRDGTGAQKGSQRVCGFAAPQSTRHGAKPFSSEITLRVKSAEHRASNYTRTISSRLLLSLTSALIYPMVEPFVCPVILTPPRGETEGTAFGEQPHKHHDGPRTRSA